MKLAFDVDQFVDTVQSIATALWEHVCKRTQSVNERRGRNGSINNSIFAGRVKRLRRAYLVSLIIFINNSECNSPFHAALRVVIESCGGSTQLITILNRFGICSSVDTLKRIIHSVALHRKTAGIKSLLVDKAFTVASTDNVDFLQSNAAVYSGDQHRSWHAASIQLMPNTATHSEQSPLPNTAIESEQNGAVRRLFSTAGEATASESTESSSSQHAHVPAQSSIISKPADKLHLLLSRKRTERTNPIASPLRSTRSPRTKRARTFAEAANHHRKDVPLDGFPIFKYHSVALEQSAADKLNEILFSYLFMKEASCPNKVLVDLGSMTLPNIPKALMWCIR